MRKILIVLILSGCGMIQIPDEHIEMEFDIKSQHSQKSIVENSKYDIQKVA